MNFFLLTIDLRSSFAQRWWSNIERTPIHLFFFKNLYSKSLHLLTFVCISLLHPIKAITMVIDSTRWVLFCPARNNLLWNWVIPPLTNLLISTFYPPPSRLAPLQIVPRTMYLLSMQFLSLKICKVMSI